MSAGPSAADVAALLFARRAEWLPRYFPAGRKVGSVFELGSADGDPGRSFPVPLHRQPRVQDFAGGFSGDDLALFGRAIGAGDDMAKAYREALAYLGLAPGSTAPTARPPRPAQSPPEPDRTAEQRAATALWRASRPIEATDTAGRYLRARGCAMPSPDGDLHWSPDVPHPSGYVGAALVGLITDAVTGEAMSLHRTWICPDGTKAPIERPRLLWPVLPSFGVCRLFDDAEVTTALCIGEGIETALAAALAFGPATWATLSAGNMAKLPVLPGVECITVIADHDRPNRHGRRAGEAAAAEVGRRWRDAGREVRIWISAIEGADFADVAQAERAA